MNKKGINHYIMFSLILFFVALTLFTIFLYNYNKNKQLDIPGVEDEKSIPEDDKQQTVVIPTPSATQQTFAGGGGGGSSGGGGGGGGDDDGTPTPSPTSSENLINIASLATLTSRPYSSFLKRTVDGIDGTGVTPQTNVYLFDRTFEFRFDNPQPVSKIQFMLPTEWYSLSADTTGDGIYDTDLQVVSADSPASLIIGSPGVINVDYPGELQDTTEIRFRYNGDTLPAELDFGVTYYLSGKSGNSFYLYDTNANARNGGETGRINLFGSQSGIHIFGITSQLWGVPDWTYGEWSGAFPVNVYGIKYYEPSIIRFTKNGSNGNPPQIGEMVYDWTTEGVLRQRSGTVVALDNDYIWIREENGIGYDWGATGWLAKSRTDPSDRWVYSSNIDAGLFRALYEFKIFADENDLSQNTINQLDEFNNPTLDPGIPGAVEGDIVQVDTPDVSEQYLKIVDIEGAWEVGAPQWTVGPTDPRSDPTYRNTVLDLHVIGANTARLFPVTVGGSHHSPLLFPSDYDTMDSPINYLAMLANALNTDGLRLLAGHYGFSYGPHPEDNYTSDQVKAGTNAEMAASGVWGVDPAGDEFNYDYDGTRIKAWVDAIKAANPNAITVTNLAATLMYWNNFYDRIGHVSGVDYLGTSASVTLDDADGHWYPAEKAATMIGANPNGSTSILLSGPWAPGGDYVVRVVTSAGSLSSPFNVGDAVQNRVSSPSGYGTIYKVETQQDTNTQGVYWISIGPEGMSRYLWSSSAYVIYRNSDGVSSAPIVSSNYHPYMDGFGNHPLFYETFPPVMLYGAMLSSAFHEADGISYYRLHDMGFFGGYNFHATTGFSMLDTLAAWGGKEAVVPDEILVLASIDTAAGFVSYDYGHNVIGNFPDGNNLGYISTSAVSEILLEEGLPYREGYLSYLSDFQNIPDTKVIIVSFAWHGSDTGEAAFLQEQADAGKKIIILNRVNRTNLLFANYSQLILSPNVVVISGDISHGVTPEIRQHILSEIHSALGDDRPTYLNKYNNDVELAVMEGTGNHLGDRYLLVTNWENHPVTVDVGVNLPSGNYRVLQRDLTETKKMFINGNEVLTNTDLERFRVDLDEGEARIFYINFTDENLSSYCGNEVIEAGEQCDGINLSGETCISLGYDMGNLNCDNCNFDVLNCSNFSSTSPPELKNVILFIGDGMGPEQVKAASYYLSGAQGGLSFESFLYQGYVTTNNAGGGTTDSAAAATAIATGFKVNNGVISMAIPGNGSDLETILEHYKNLGKSTGLVTTTYVTHATPAGFGAHETSRNNYNNIASDYLIDSRPNVLFGGAKYMPASPSGYIVVKNYSELMSLDTESQTYVSGQFGIDYMPYEFDGLGEYPHLSNMTEIALNILDNNQDGFFLMVEGGRIDHAGHDNNITNVVFEGIEFSNAVQTAVNWMASRNDTLIIVTADHETGGLTVTQNNGQGNIPDASWSTTGHTSTNVPVYAIGINADSISSIMDNTDFFDIMKSTIQLSPQSKEYPLQSKSFWQKILSIFGLVVQDLNDITGKIINVIRK